MCEEPWFEFQTGGKAGSTLWAASRPAGATRPEQHRESGRAPLLTGGESTAPPPPHYSPCRFTDHPQTTFPAGKNEVDSELQQLLSFLQKRNEGEPVSKRRRRDQTMSHYPEDKRMSGYWGDWGARGAFCSAPQGWNPMGIPAMPGPYYPTHVVPAHSHSHVNQWNPSAKIQHAHSQPKPLESTLPTAPLVGRDSQPGTVDLSAHSDPIRMRSPTEVLEKPVQLTKPRVDVVLPDRVPAEENVDIAEGKAKVKEDKEISSTRLEAGLEKEEEPLQAEAPTQSKSNNPPELQPPVEDVATESPAAPVSLLLPIEPPEANEPPTVTCSESTAEPAVSGSETTTQLTPIVSEENNGPIVTCSEATSQPTVSSTSTDVKPQAKEARKKKKAPKKRPKSKPLVVDAKKSKPVKVVKPVERRGPMLEITGPKDAPFTVVILNGPKNDDDDDKKPTARNSKPLEHRGLTRQGLFSSTLSARYDAARPDPTWVCVFCKLGPHARGLGDLFGPYAVSKEPQEDLCEFSGDEQDIVETQKRGGRTKKSIRMNHLLDHFRTISRKLKRRQPQNEGQAMSGLLPMSDDEGDAPRYEVWTHEMCAVWSPGVCLVDTGLLGLQDAVWHCYQAMCSKCGLLGANIGCIHRNCPNRSHYACALDAGWSLPLETFISTCHFHVQKS